MLRSLSCIQHAAAYEQPMSSNVLDSYFETEIRCKMSVNWIGNALISIQKYQQEYMSKVGLKNTGRISLSQHCGKNIINQNTIHWHR